MTERYYEGIIKLKGDNMEPLESKCVAKICDPVTLVIVIATNDVIYICRFFVYSIVTYSELFCN